MSGTLSASNDPQTLSGGFATTSAVWKPRFAVFVNKDGVHAPQAIPDTPLTTALSVQVQKSNWFQADRHRIICSLWGDPAFGIDFWSSFDSMGVLVKIAFEGSANNSDFTEVFRGFVDKVQIDPIKGTVTLLGRNALGLLIDYNDVQFTGNESARDILTDVITATGLADPTFDGDNLPAQLDEPYGRYWPNETGDGDKTSNTKGHQSQLNPFDVVNQICRDIGLGYWTDAGIIHFMGVNIGGDTSFTAIFPTTDYADSPNVAKLTPSNCTSIMVEHDLNISQWNWYTSAINFPSSGVPQDKPFIWPPDGDTQDFAKAIPFVSANRHPDDNEAIGQSVFKEFVLHEWIVTVKVAGPQIMGLDFSRQIGISGTGTRIDGPYLIDSIEHQISFERGYVGTVRGRWGRNNGEATIGDT